MASRNSADLGAATLGPIAACVFDAYGTVFDFSSAASACKDRLGEQTAALTTLWRDKQLQYTWLRSLQGRHADFWQITGEALDYALDTLGIADLTLRQHLMDLYFTLKPFAEVPDMLRRLRSAGVKTAILSNGSPAMLNAAVAGAGIGDLLDAVISVEEVGVFKPHPRVYQHACDRLDVGSGNIAFVSSNSWDAYAASAFGMRVIWCNRYGQRSERLPGHPDRQIGSLTELPLLVCP